MSDCPVDSGECLEWVHEYLMDCVCNFRDQISLVLGLISIVSWGVAEVPQIITNFKEKTTEGVSLAFLMTWVVGDVFNLAGCWLEPATLPTQFYMAALYTFTTLILVGQTIYYDYIHVRPPEFMDEAAIEGEAKKPAAKVDVESQPLRPADKDSSSSPESTSINVPRIRRASSRDLYYTSARSLASSHTPTAGSYLVGSRGDSGGKGHGFLQPSDGSRTSGGEENPIHHDSASPRAEGALSKSSNSPAGSLARTAAAASVLLVGGVGLTSNYLSAGSFGGFAAQAGGARRLLQVQASYGPRGGRLIPHYFREAQPEGPWGEVFGWCMAAIYMGGRLPQIMLNIKRGTVEGLNPLMFIFALVGNLTYVSSILVRTLDWDTIKPNMPWLVDAAVCVGLDCFIICQFVYYAARVKGADDSEKEENKKGDYHLVQ